MQTEYEIRVLEINTEELEKKILDLGGHLVQKYNQKRYVYDLIPKQPKKWIRLRTDGSNTTLTLKNITEASISGTKELEFVVADFEKCNLFLNEIGFQAKVYQENKRVRYLLNDTEIDFDTWPLIPTFMEIEGDSEEQVNAMIDLLELEKSKITAMDVEDIYLHYGHILDDIKELKFEKEGI